MPAENRDVRGNELKPAVVDASEDVRVNGASVAADHDNADHTEAFVFDGDGVERRIWVIAAGAADPADATADDLIFEEQ